MFNMDTVVIIFLPTSIVAAIILSIVVWLQDRHNHTLTERRDLHMFFKGSKKHLAERKETEIRNAIESLKLYTSKKSVQDDLEAIGIVPFKMAELFLNDFADKHPIAKEKVTDLLKLLQQQP